MYGGTKTEMERLISDANEYAESIGQASDLSIDSFSDIVTAIDLIQQKQHIAGTTSREAATTIEGSLNTVKAAWENLLTGFADPEADIGELVTQLVDSAVVAFENLMPAIEQALVGIGDFITQIVPMISEKLPELIEELLPPLIENAMALVGGLVEALPDILESLYTALSEVFTTIMEQLTEGEIDFSPLTEGIVGKLQESFESADFSAISQMLIDKMLEGFEAVGDFTEIGAEIVDGFIQSASDAAPGAIEIGTLIVNNVINGIMSLIGNIGNAAQTIITSLISALTSNAPQLIASAASIMANLITGLINNSAKMIGVGAKVISSLIAGLAQNAPQIAQAAIDLIAKLLNALLQNAPKLLQAGIQMVAQLAAGIIQNLPSLLAAGAVIMTGLHQIISKVNWPAVGINLVKSIASGIAGGAGTIANAARSAAKSAFNAIANHPWTQAGVKAIKGVVSGFTSMVSSFVGKAKGAVNSAKSAMSGVSFTDVGSAIIQGVVSGVTSAAGALASAAVSAVQGALSAAKNAIQIHSPSRVFAREVGKPIADGMAVGITNNAHAVDDAVVTTLKTSLKRAREAAVSTVDKSTVYDKILDNIVKKVKKKAKKDKMKGGEVAQAILDSATKRLDNMKNVYNMSIQDEVKYWDQVVKHIKKGTQARKDAEKSYWDMRLKMQTANVKEATSGTNGANSILKIARGSNQDIIAAGQQWLDNYKVYHETADKYDMEFWDKIRTRYKTGTQERIDADKKYLEAQKSYYNALLTNYENKVSGGLVLSADKAAKGIIAQAKQAGADQVTAARAWLDNYKVYHDTSLEYDLKFWKRIVNNQKAATAERIAAQKEYNAVALQLQQERQEKAEAKQNANISKMITTVRDKSYELSDLVIKLGNYAPLDKLWSNAQQLLENFGVFHKVTLEEEEWFWRTIASYYKPGTQDYVNAWKKVFEAQEKIENARKTAQEDVASFIAEYKKAVNDSEVKKAELEEERIQKLGKVEKKELEDLQQLEEKYQSDIQKVNEKLEKDIESLTDKYLSSVESRKKSIMGSAGLLDRIKYDKTFSKEYMQEVLSEQVGALEEWDKELDALEAKLGSQSPILQEFEDMGVGSLYTLKEFNSMTADELQAYAKMYEKKASVAQARAEQENKALLDETNKQIQALKDQAQQERNTLLSEYVINRATIADEAAKERAEINAQINQSIAELEQKTKETLNNLQEKLETGLKDIADTSKLEASTIGDCIAEGMAEGMERSQGIINAAATKAAADALAAAKAALGVKSPSKEFEKVGKFVDEGFAKGIKGNLRLVKDTVKESFNVSGLVSSVNPFGKGAQGAEDGSNGRNGGFTQNLTINSPQALTPFEIARQTRLANQQMVLALNGV